MTAPYAPTHARPLPIRQLKTPARYDATTLSIAAITALAVGLLTGLLVSPHLHRNRAPPTVTVTRTVASTLPATVTATPAPTAHPQPPTYTVKAGDTVASIAVATGHTMLQLDTWNPVLVLDATLHPGQKLRLSRQ